MDGHCILHAHMHVLYHNLSAVCEFGVLIIRETFAVCKSVMSECPSKRLDARDIPPLSECEHPAAPRLLLLPPTPSLTHPPVRLKIPSRTTKVVLWQVLPLSMRPSSP